MEALPVRRDIADFMGRIGLPGAVAAQVERMVGDIYARGCGGILQEVADKLHDRLCVNILTYDDELAEVAGQVGAPPYMARFAAYALCALRLPEAYRLRGISDEIYWDTMRALGEELMECVDCGRAVGAMANGWSGGFIDMTRFKLGRFQYELWPFGRAVCRKGEHAVFRGEPAINIHIPSMDGPIVKEARMDSYRRAWRFFRDSFGGDVLPFMCDSWLLFPRHREFLPGKSTIIDFMGDFDIISSVEEDAFSNGWRIYKDKDHLPPDQLPRDTSLQRAYADWMARGNKTGSGLGVFFFDGERIL